MNDEDINTEEFEKQFRFLLLQIEEDTRWNDNVWNLLHLAISTRIPLSESFLREFKSDLIKSIWIQLLRSQPHLSIDFQRELNIF